LIVEITESSTTTFERLSGEGKANSATQVVVSTDTTRSSASFSPFLTRASRELGAIPASVPEAHCQGFRIPSTAETLANENSMTLIKARSRNPCRESVGMEDRSVLASSTLKTGVLPHLTTWVGPLTSAAGLVGTIWLITK